MKKNIILTTMTIFLLSISSYGQLLNQNQEVILKNKLSQSRLTDGELNQAYDSLNQLIEKKATAPSTKTLLELCLLYAKHDMSDAPYAFAYTIKKINPKEFEKALKELSKADQKKIKEFIEIAEEVRKHGNG